MRISDWSSDVCSSDLHAHGIESRWIGFLGGRGVCRSIRHSNRHRIQAWLGSPVKWADLKLYRLWYIWAGRRTDVDVMSYSDTRAQMKKVLDKVVMDHATVVISRPRGQSVVVVSLADWKALEETERLIGSTKT